MVTGGRIRGVLVLLVIVGTLCCSSTASASNELFFNEAIEVADVDTGIRTIEVDASGNVFATFGSVLYKLSDSGSVLAERTFEKEITATAISPDFTKLALTLRSGSSGDDSIFILSTGDLSTQVSSDTTRTNAFILEWSPNGGDLYSNDPNAGMIQLNRETLAEDVSYLGNHTGTMACVDISGNSGAVLTADENGLIQLWNNDGDVIQHEFQLQSSILDCAIGYDDQYFSVSTPEDGIRKWTFSGSELKPIDVNGAERYQFTTSGDKVIVHKSTPSQHILVYDYVNEISVNQISMFHTFDDYVVMFDGAGTISDIFLNSKVDYIVKYGTSIERVGVGASGIDTDGDGVPDTLDDDDDGDGIEDNWDLNCADVGIACDLLPDEDLVRSINLNINKTNFIVEQTFTFNKATSASIRDLSRLSLDNDVRLSSDEAQLFASTICSNIDQDAASAGITSTITIENASLNFTHMDCSIEQGMTLVPTNDRTSHIRYSISFVYDIETTQPLDGTAVDVENHRFPSSGSVTELSDQHPIRITIGGPTIITQVYVPWHIQQSDVTFNLESVKEKNDNLNPKNILSSPLTIGIILVGIFVVGFVAQRLYDIVSKSGYDIELDDEDDEDDASDADELDDDYEDEAYYHEEAFEEEPVEEAVTEPVKRRPARRKTVGKTSKRVPIDSSEATQAKELLEQSSNEVVRKRRARRSEQDPGTSKRRKLSDVEPGDSRPRKRRAVRRDVANADEMDEALKRFVSESPEE